MAMIRTPRTQTIPQPALLSAPWRAGLGILSIGAGLAVYFLTRLACPPPISIWLILGLTVLGVSLIVTTAGTMTVAGRTGAVAVLLVIGAAGGTYVSQHPDLMGFTPCETGLFLKGDVHDAVSGKALTAVNVVVKGLSVGDPKTKLTDNEGSFGLDLPLKIDTGDPLVLVEFRKNRYQGQTLRLYADSLKTQNRFLAVQLQPEGAQSYRFAGRVVGAGHNGLADVLVVSDDGTRRCRTDAEGFFNLTFENKNQLVLRLTFQKADFKPYVQDFDLPDDDGPYEKNDIRIVLNPSKP